MDWRETVWFCFGEKTDDAIFALRQLTEAHREKRTGFLAVFQDLEKARGSTEAREVEQGFEKIER